MNPKMRRATKRRISLFRLRMVVLGWVVAAVAAAQHDPNRSCPSECTCDDVLRRVECVIGGMREIPVSRLEHDILALIITPPMDYPNYISLGPILTQPEPFSDLKELTLVWANIPSIGVNSFWGLKNLKILNLNHNNITTINAENFRGLINLITLRLDHNQIQEIPSDTFKYMTNLKRLNLSRNKISTLVPRLFRMLDKLFELDLSFNPLFELNPEVFKDIQHLTVFKCRACSLSHINGQIYHLARNMEELDLGENLFKYLTADEFTNLNKLKKLQLDHNQLSVIVDHIFINNRELQILEIQHNRLALLAPASLINLTKLRELDISNNKIEKFHLQAFASASDSLKSMDLSSNNLSLNEIAILIQVLPKMENLVIANLSLTDIPPNFFMYNNRIMLLNISHNKLTQFPIKLLEHKKTRHLRTLDISNNKLTSLDESDLRRMEGIPLLYLSNNEWHCDQCSVNEMLTYMNTTVLNETIRQLQCRSPQRLRGVKFSSLTFDQLETCPPTYHAQIKEFAGLLLVLAAVLATVAITLFCTRRRNGNYYTNEEKRRQRNRNQPEEVLTLSQNGSVATIHAACQEVTNNS